MAKLDVCLVILLFALAAVVPVFSTRVQIGLEDSTYQAAAVVPQQYEVVADSEDAPPVLDEAAADSEDAPPVLDEAVADSEDAAPEQDERAADADTTRGSLCERAILLTTTVKSTAAMTTPPVSTTTPEILTSVITDSPMDRAIEEEDNSTDATTISSASSNLTTAGQANNATTPTDEEEETTTASGPATNTTAGAGGLVATTVGEISGENATDSGPGQTTTDASPGDDNSTVSSNLGNENNTTASPVDEESGDNNSTDTTTSGNVTTSLPDTTTASSSNVTDSGEDLSNSTTTTAPATGNVPPMPPTPPMPPVPPTVPLPDIHLITGSVLPVLPGTSALLVLANGTVLGTSQGWPMILPNGTLFSYPSSIAPSNASAPGATLVPSIPLNDGAALIPISAGTSSITVLPHGIVLQTPVGLQSWNSPFGTAGQQPVAGAGATSQPSAPVPTYQGWGQPMVPVAPTNQGWGHSTGAIGQQVPSYGMMGGLGQGFGMGYPQLGSGLGGFGSYGYGGPGFSGLGYSAGYGLPGMNSVYPQVQSSGWGSPTPAVSTSSGWGSTPSTTTVAPVVVKTVVEPQHSGWGSSGGASVVAPSTAPLGYGGLSSSTGMLGYGGLGGTGAQLSSPVWQPFQGGMAMGLGLLGLRSGNISDILKQSSHVVNAAKAATSSFEAKPDTNVAPRNMPFPGFSGPQFDEEAQIPLANHGQPAGPIFFPNYRPHAPLHVQDDDDR